MKTRAACALLLLLATTGRAADVAKQVHDAVRDFVDLKLYAWRESRELGAKALRVASGRTEVDGCSIGVFNWRRSSELAFVNLGAQTAFRTDAGWKLAADMDVTELNGTLGMTPPGRAVRPGVTPHWNFVPPHDVLVAIVGMAPAPDWIGDKIVGILALDDAAGLWALLESQGRIDLEPAAPAPPMVRNKLNMPVPAPTRAPKILRVPMTPRPLVRMRNADYELYFRDALIAKLVIHLESVPLDANGEERGNAQRDTWIFEFSEVGRIDVTPDPAAKALLTS